MGNTYGRQVLGQVGRSIQLSADGKPEMKSAGVTIDWSLVAAYSGADLILEDGVIIKDGDKYLRYGQCIAKVTTAEQQTVDLSGDDDPTGGTWSATILGTLFSGLAYNITAAALQALINGINGVDDADLVTVTKSGFVYTITFPASMLNVAAITTNNGVGFTGGGGDTFAITVTPVTQGVANAGKFGPADTTASDGRQTLTRGNCFLVNETVIEYDLHSDHPPAVEGGKVWKARIVIGGNNPALSAIEAAMPRLSYAQ